MGCGAWRGCLSFDPNSFAVETHQRIIFCALSIYTWIERRARSAGLPGRWFTIDGVAVVQLNFWVNASLASQMVEGSLTSLTYGFSLMIMAQAAIAQSVAIAAMPTFSAQHALNQQDEMRASLASSLRGILLMAIPASVGLILLREPLITFLFKRGKFDEHDVQLTAWALLWYAAGIVGHSVMEILTRAFYAQHDTKTPVIIGTIAMGLNVVFSITFAKVFESSGMDAAWRPGACQFICHRT